MSWFTSISSLSEFDSSGKIVTPMILIGWLSTLLMVAIAGMWLAGIRPLSPTPQQVLLIGIPGLLYHGIESSLQTALRLGKWGDISGASAALGVLFTGTLFVCGFLGFNQVIVQTVAGQAALVVSVSSIFYVPKWAYRKR